jgi:hypothetical protein
VSADRSASALTRLLNRSRSTGENYNLLLSRFAIERLLYRLSVSPHASSFVLKGALLFTLWCDAPHRPTKDADLLGFGADDEETLRARFNDICAIDANDGVRYDAQSIRIAPIREDNAYGGLRLTVTAYVGTARLPVQVDIGFGDAITPAPESVSYPTLLDDLAAPLLRAYPVYTVIAEKLHAMVVLGMSNSRMKDFFDLAVIARSMALDGEVLVEALRATFARRATAMPNLDPVALMPAFADDPEKTKQWRAFLVKLKLRDEALADVITLLRAFLLPPLQATVDKACSGTRWNPKTAQWARGKSSARLSNG